LLIAFLISFLIVLSSTMGQKDLGVLYEDLLGFGIMIDKNFLKCMDQ